SPAPEDIRVRSNAHVSLIYYVWKVYLESTLETEIQKMKARFLFVYLLLQLPFGKLSATHLAGGELTYKWISGTTYEFTATFYRDCAGVYPGNTLSLNY